MSSWIIDRQRTTRGGLRSDGKSIDRTQTWMYWIGTDSASVQEDEVLATPGLPTVGITAIAPGVICSSKDADRTSENATVWVVACEFSTSNNNQNEDQNNPSQDPTTWFPNWKMTIETEQFPDVCTAEGEPYVNSAGDPFDEGRMRTIPICVWQFTQYENKELTKDQISSRTDTVNSEVIDGFEIGTLRLTIEAAEKGFFANGYESWKVFYKLRYRKGLPPTKYKLMVNGVVKTPTSESGWMGLRLDYGPYYVAGGLRRACLDDDGNRTQLGLDGTGNKVSVGTMPTILGFNDLAYIDFNQFLRVQ